MNEVLGLIARAMQQKQERDGRVGGGRRRNQHVLHAASFAGH